MTLPSSCGSTNSLNDASITTTEQETAFIAYVNVLEDQVNALKDNTAVASVQTRLTVGGNRVSPPDEIIASTGTSNASAAIIDELRRDRAAQKEAMASLTALLNTMLTQTPSVGGTGTGGGGGGNNITKENTTK